jgi:hypothetical protein
VLADLRWRRSATIAGIGYPRDVAGFAGGYVIVAEDGVRFSIDGRSWRKVTLPRRAHSVGPPEALAVATYGRTVVVVGSETYEPCVGDWGPPDSTGGGGPVCRMSPIAWRSTDGITWRRSLAWPTPAVETDAYRGLDATAWPVPGDGWDAALTYVLGDETHLVGVFHSGDGRVWTALAPNLPARVRNDATTLGWEPGAADRAGRRVLVQTDVEEGVGAVGRLHTAVAGMTWTTAPAPATSPEVAAIVARSSGSVRWLLGGTSHDAAGASRPMTWATPDLTTWSAAELPLGEAAGGTLSDLVATRWGYAAVGNAWASSEDDLPRPVGWVSEDGSAWTAVSVPADGNSTIAGVLTDGPWGVLGAGWLGNDETGDWSIVVWLLR